MKEATPTLIMECYVYCPNCGHKVDLAKQIDGDFTDDIEDYDAYCDSDDCDEEFILTGY